MKTVPATPRSQAAAPAPNETLLRFGPVCAKTGFKRTSLYRAIQRDGFPKPIKIGPRASAWALSSVNSWIADRMAQGGAK